MKEIIEKRRPHCKVFDLGGRKRKVRVSRAPLHYVRDGKLVDIDTTPRLAAKLLEVTEAPYRLKIDPERPAYFYTNETGRQVEVELVAIDGQSVKAGRSVQEAGAVRWKGIAPATDVAFRPLRKGIEALVVLHGPDAPRSWTWRVRGDKDLLLPPKGHDAKQQRLELDHVYDGDLLTIIWSGRATSQRKLRQKEGFSDEIVWPVVIDPTINESIANGADDVHSFFGVYADYVRTDDIVLAAATYGFYGNLYVGLRWANLPIPQGARIISAMIAIDVVNIFGSPLLTVVGNAVDDAPQWSISNRMKDMTRTSADVQITPGATGPYPISVTGIVQEIINRSGWAAGNALAFGLLPGGAGEGFNFVYVAALEHATRTEAQLEIEYEEAAAARVAPKMMHYRRLRI